MSEAPERRPDEMAVVVALGARGTAGYAARIDRPCLDTATAQVLTHPFHAVARLTLAVVEV